MAKSKNNIKAVLKDTADAIRAKKDSEELIEPRDFADEITSIPTGPELENGNLYFYQNDEIEEVGESTFGHLIYYYKDPVSEESSFYGDLGDPESGIYRYTTGGSGGTVASLESLDLTNDSCYYYYNGEMGPEFAELDSLERGYDYHVGSDFPSTGSIRLYSEGLYYLGFSAEPSDPIHLTAGSAYTYNDYGDFELYNGLEFVVEDYGFRIANVEDPYAIPEGFYYCLGSTVGESFIEGTYVNISEDQLMYHSSGESFTDININAGSKYVYNGGSSFESYTPSVDDFSTEELQAALGMYAGSVYYANGGSGIELLDMSDYGIYSYNPNYHEVTQAELPESGAKTTIAVGDLGEYVYQEPVYYDIFNANEAVIPSGTLEITENGENINVSQYAAVNVDVPTGPELEDSTIYFKHNGQVSEYAEPGIYSLGSNGLYQQAGIDSNNVYRYIGDTGDEYSFETIDLSNDNGYVYKGGGTFEESKWRLVSNTYIEPETRHVYYCEPGSGWIEDLGEMELYSDTLYYIESNQIHKLDLSFGFYKYYGGSSFEEYTFTSDHIYCYDGGSNILWDNGALEENNLYIRNDSWEQAFTKVNLPENSGQSVTIELGDNTYTLTKN